MSIESHQVLGDLISASYRLTRVASRAAGRESGAVGRTLSVLSSAGPMRLGELAERSLVSQPTATKLVTGLVARGWVERRPDVADARVSVTAITEAGEAALASWRSEMATAIQPLFDDLTEPEVETLRRAVEIVRLRVIRSERGTAE